jgi:hypothetical protein
MSTEQSGKCIQRTTDNPPSLKLRRDKEVRSQKSEVRSQKSEIRNQRSEVRGQSSEVRGQRSEVRGQRGSGFGEFTMHLPVQKARGPAQRIGPTRAIAVRQKARARDRDESPP